MLTETLKILELQPEEAADKSPLPILLLLMRSRTLMKRSLPLRKREEIKEIDLAKRAVKRSKKRNPMKAKAANLRRKRS